MQNKTAEVLAQVGEAFPNLPVLMVTDTGTIAYENRPVRLFTWFPSNRRTMADPGIG